MDDETVVDPGGGPGRRVVALLGLLVVAGLALPVAAWLVEAVADQAENWILPLQFGLVLGVAITYALRPRRSGDRNRALLLSAAAAVVATLIADAVWLFGIAG